MRGYLWVAVAATVCASPASASTFLTASVAALAQAVDAYSNTELSSGGQTAIAPTSLSGTASANVTGVLAHSAVNATFASADAGSVEVVWGWSVDPGVFQFQVATGSVTQRNWTYSFVSSVTGSFNVTYDIVALGYTAGLNPLAGLDDLAPFSFNGVGIDPSASGNFNVPLLAGHSYTMSIGNTGRLVDGQSATSNAMATIYWNITSGAKVPEPGSWAMLILGFGVVGVAGRQRRRIEA